jgi:hypothetical protein
MPEFTNLLMWEGLAFLLALFGIVLVRVMTGSLRTRGLIEGTTARGTRFVSAGRLQLLIVSTVAALQYLTQVWQNPQRFPDIPQNWLLFFGGSQVLYLGSKFHGRRNHRFHI